MFEKEKRIYKNWQSLQVCLLAVKERIFKRLFSERIFRGYTVHSIQEHVTGKGEKQRY